MPNYDYRCRSCGSKRLDVFNRISECKTHAPQCCGTGMDIFISVAPYGWVDREIRYRCPVTNAGVTSRKQRNEIMAEHGLIDANDIVNEKTIAAAAEKHEKEKAFVESIRGPKEVAQQVRRWAMQ